MAIDWNSIAQQVGDNYDTAAGRKALEIIVGEGNVRDAVDYWISQEPGGFAAESVLSVMPLKWRWIGAMKSTRQSRLRRCYPCCVSAGKFRR